MTTLQVVVGHEAVQVTLDFLDGQVEGLPSLHPEALIEEGTVHPFHKAIGARASHLGVSMLDVLHSEHQLIGMGLGLATELPAVIGQDRLYRHTQCVVEGQHPFVEQIASCYRPVTAYGPGRACTLHSSGPDASPLFVATCSDLP